MDRKLMHQKLSCFNKSVQEFDNATATLVSELDQVQGLDSSERKNAVCLRHGNVGEQDHERLQ